VVPPSSPSRRDDHVVVVEKPMLVTMTTRVPASVDDQLHAAAYERGGEAEKSRIVRDALGELLAELEDLQARDGAAFQSRLRTISTVGPSGIVRQYRIESATKDRLTTFAARYRVPLAAMIRAALLER